MDLFSSIPDPDARRPPRTPAGTGDGGDPAGREGRLYTVTRFNEAVKRVLTDHLGGSLRVRGELSGLRRTRHWYFTLKDDASELSCVAWASTAARFDRTLADGDEVTVTGRVDHWTKGGRTQFYVSRIERAGLGPQQLAYQRLLAELRALGWFDEASKRPLPVFPRRIAVVTAASGAAITDVVRTAASRLPAVGLVLYDVRVQGDAAAGEVVRALRRAEAEAADRGVDAILVTRGGGSMEDLAAFNARSVAEAVRACRVPVVAAIGHESDTTIIELVADRRASTPTQAAMVLVPDGAEFRVQVEMTAGRLDGVLRQRLRTERARVSGLAGRPVLAAPASLLAGRRASVERLAAARRAASTRRLAAARLRVAGLRGRWLAVRPHARHTARRSAVAALAAGLDAAVRRAVAGRRSRVPAAERLAAAARADLRRRRERLAALGRGLELVAPDAVLRRGFTYTLREDDGRLVRGPADAPAGRVLRTQGADGTIRSIVTPDEGPAAPPQDP